MDDERHQAYRQAHFPSPLWQETQNPDEMELRWQKVITKLAPFVDVIHAQTWGEDTPDSFADNPSGTQTGRLLLHALCEIQKIDQERELTLVAEYNPGIKRLLIPYLSRRFAKQYLEAMRSIVSEIEIM